MNRIEQTYIINASPEEVWAALTDPTLQAKWTGQRAQYDARVGGRYQLFDDYVTGEIVEAEAPNKLSQTWKPNDWTIDNSMVSFVLKKVPEGTQVELLHENVQPEDFEGTNEGWNQYYLGAIKTMLEAENIKPKAKAARKPTRAKKPVRKAAAKQTAAAKRNAVAKKIATGKRATGAGRTAAKKTAARKYASSAKKKKG